MKISTIIGAASLFVSLGALAPSSYGSDPNQACSDLLDTSERLLRIDDQRVGVVASEKLRQAVSACSGAEISAQLRARMLMASVSLHSADRAAQRDIWLQAISTLRRAAPDADALLMEAMEGLSGAEFNLGAYEKAVQIAREALHERESRFGPRSRQYVRGLTFVAATYQAVSQVQERESNLVEAQSYGERAVEVARSSLGLRDGTTIAAAAVLKGVLKARGLDAEYQKLAEETAPYIDLEDPLDS